MKQSKIKIGDARYEIDYRKEKSICACPLCWGTVYMDGGKIIDNTISGHGTGDFVGYQYPDGRIVPEKPF